MAEVQLALQRGPAGFEKLVVVKLVHESLASQKTFVDMLLDEARVAALVKHPNVVDIYELGEVDGRYYIAMEYLEGEPLLSVLRAGREGKRLDVHSTARLIADTASGLDAAHELRTLAGEPIELVHHDVSLGNIVVLYNGQVKLVDFGVAKASASATGAGHRVQGKFSYMSPEKLQGASGDRRSDLWSLGVVLWEALTLKRLFRGGNDSDTMTQVLEVRLDPPSAVNSDVPPVFDAIVMRALARDPDQRYPTAKEMADDLENVLTQARYGAKNDAIGRYMQETFKDHIAARKKLVQEVSSKGSASTEILDLAFSDPLIASGSAPGQNDFSVRFRRSSIEIPLANVAAGSTEEPSQPRVITASELANSSRASGEVPVARPTGRSTPPPMDTARPSPLADVVLDGGAGDLRQDATPIPRVTSQRLQLISKPKTAMVEAVVLPEAKPRSRLPIVLLAIVLVAGGAAAAYVTLLRDRGDAPPPRIADAGVRRSRRSTPRRSPRARSRCRRRRTRASPWARRRRGDRGEQAGAAGQQGRRRAALPHRRAGLHQGRPRPRAPGAQAEPGDQRLVRADPSHARSRLREAGRSRVGEDGVPEVPPARAQRRRYRADPREAGQAVTRAAVVAAVLAAAGVAEAAPRKVLVLALDGSADGATRARLSGEVARLARLLDGTISTGESTFADAAAAVGCSPAETGCAEQVPPDDGGRRARVGTADSERGKVTLTVHRTAHGQPPRAQVATVATSEPAQAVDAPITPLFNAPAGRRAAGEPATDAGEHARADRDRAATGPPRTQPRDRDDRGRRRRVPDRPRAVGRRERPARPDRPRADRDARRHPATQGDRGQGAELRAVGRRARARHGLALGGYGGYRWYKDRQAHPTVVVPAPVDHGAALVVRGAW